MKQLLNFISLIIFFFTFKKTNIFYTSWTLMTITAIYIIIKHFIYKRNQKNTIISLITTIIFSGFVLNSYNDIFLKYKTTTIYIIFSLILIINQYFTKKQFIKTITNNKLYQDYKIWCKINLFFSFFFAICAITNIYISFWLPQDTWVNFKVFGLNIATIFCILISIIYANKKIQNN